MTITFNRCLTSFFLFDLDNNGSVIIIRYIRIVSREINNVIRYSHIVHLVSVIARLLALFNFYETKASKLIC